MKYNERDMKFVSVVRRVFIIELINIKFYIAYCMFTLYIYMCYMLLIEVIFIFIQIQYVYSVYRVHMDIVNYYACRFSFPRQMYDFQ